MTFQATKTDLIITIVKGDYIFTKYDNISISTLIYRELYKYSPRGDKFNTLKIIIIETYPYTRNIDIGDFKKIILNTKKKFNLGDFINASKIQNEIQQAQ
jgi:hypothetical protein